MGKLIDLSLEREKRRPMPKIEFFDEIPPKTLPVLIMQQMLHDVYQMSEKPNE